MAPQSNLLPLLILTEEIIRSEEATSSASSSTSSLLSTSFLYALVTLGIVAIFICLVSFLYELSDQHRRTRFAAWYESDDAAVGLSGYGTFRDCDGHGDGLGEWEDRIRFEACGIIQEGE
ncbi:MAG: hypothetical protein LQ343_005214 [Gyalolechia ehrenbergii]|nr:MAG: hypothetical protein LQ343_005214 [Gyalolechia ehrenbergii]